MNFLKYKTLYFSISIILIITSILSLSIWRLKPAIDFTGGTLIEYQLEQPANLNQIRSILKENANTSIAGLQTAGHNQLIVKTPQISQAQAQKIKKTLQQKLNQNISELRFETIGPTLGKELLTKTMVAVLLTAIFILSYVAWTFKNVQYGFSAILAMFHDSLILLGSFSLLGHFYGIEVDTLFVTAVLTTLSFSVHDTVVVYDRIRESLKQHPTASFTDLANKSLTETMGRSLNNSLTIIFMLAALLLLGGATIKWFIAALLIGTITGTYSSPFVAVPILVVWHKWKKKRKSNK